MASSVSALTDVSAIARFSQHLPDPVTMMMQRALKSAMTRPVASLSRGFSQSSKELVGVVGVGQMGGRMANNLFTKGTKLVVCDVDPANVKDLADKGAIVAKSPREVAEKCDRVITMLPNTAIVEEAFFGDNGFESAIRPSHFFIDSSTIDPIATKKLSERVHALNATFVDAPVSGGVVGAQNGTLTFMVGGSKDEFNTVKPLLELMGKNIVHCGDSSMGQVAKICNNLALAIQMTSVAEAMNLGVKLGMDPKVLAGIMNTSTSQCWSTTVYHPYPGVMEGVPSSNDYKGGFASKLVKKDLGLGVDVAKQAEVTLPLTYQVHQLFSMMVNQGYGDKDFAYVLQFLKGKTA